MADSACLVQGFSYASPIPNEPQQVNPMHALGDSVSFGRYMTESLSWEKWSTFSHKKYVEEAERYSQPGSVAQKKAYFDAYYKRIAAQKAAALLQQEIVAEGVDDDNAHRFIFNSNVKMEEAKIQDAKEDVALEANEQSSVSVVETAEEGENSVTDQETVSASENSGTPNMKRPLLKQQDPVDSHSTGKSTADSIEKQRSTLKSLMALMDLVPRKEPDKEPISVTKTTHSSKDCAAPPSDSSRMKTPTDPSVSGSKKTRKEKAGDRFRKLGCSFCFKACRSPDFYKESQH